MALYHREMTGEGQHVDVSIQESNAMGPSGAVARWHAMRRLHHRGQNQSNPNIRLTWIWPCQDGYVTWYFSGMAMGRRRKEPLIQWMDSEGMADDFLKTFDWDKFNVADLAATTQEIVDRMEGPTRRFFMAHTRAELLEGALKRHLMLFPVCTVADLLAGVQLAAREFWVEVEHPELGRTITYPGGFARISEAPLRILRRAPLIGEHNDEVYGKESGVATEGLLASGRAESRVTRFEKKSEKGGSEEKTARGVKVADFTNPKFATLQARKENEGELNRLVEEWTVSYAPEEVMTMMQRAGVAAGVLQNGQDLLEHDPQLKHRHYFWELDHPEIGKYYSIRPPFVLSKSPCELRRAPLLGEHNEYGLKEILGMSDEEIAELVIGGVIE